MTPNEIRQRFPFASEACIALNASLQSAQPQHDAPKPLAKVAGRKEKSVARIALRYRIYRIRLQDPDNAAAGTKAITDGLRRCGLIPNDSPEEISLTVEQQKVKTKSEQRTEIEIAYP